MILTYHRVTPQRSGYLYSVSCSQLDAHLKVVAELQGGRWGNFSPEVTLDDGHQSNYADALELLQKHSVRATFFVVTGWMSSEPGFMTWPELRELVSLGHHVQSHGWSHRFLPRCSASELYEELVRSKRTLEDQLGVCVDTISMPNGSWNDRVLRSCAAAGYRRVYISNPWIPPQQREGVELIGRYMVRRTLTPQQLRRFLTGDPAFLFLLRSQYRLKEALKVAMGRSVYHKLWSAFAASEDAGKPEAIQQ